MDASPAKRRALTSIDPNASPRTKLGPNELPRGPGSPLKNSVAAGEDIKQRPSGTLGLVVSETQERPAKKPRLEENGKIVEDGPAGEESPMHDGYRQPSASPTASSLFDGSSHDTTATTEPDADGARVPAAEFLTQPPTLRRLTREQVRERAETVRLRLGLASYKLRTGQIDVPLEELEQRLFRSVHVSPPDPEKVRPTSSAPVAAPSRRPLPNSRRSSREDLPEAAKVNKCGTTNRPRTESQPVLELGSEEEGHEQEEEHGERRGRDKQLSVSRRQRVESAGRPEYAALPSLRDPADRFDTPRRRRLADDDEKLTSTTRRGGAASGLLRLSMSRG